jgi:hypothetical protein
LARKGCPGFALSQLLGISQVARVFGRRERRSPHSVVFKDVRVMPVGVDVEVLVTSSRYATDSRP